MTNRYTITSALPYANGPIHIGHLAGSFLPADIYVRYLRTKRKDVVYLCGSDEHGVPITITAAKECITPQQVADKYHEHMEKALADFGISFDHYSRTSSDLHKKVSADFFTTLYEKGVFETKICDQYFDPVHNQFLADRYIKGICPHCGNNDAYGDQCEACGSTLSPVDLIHPRSAISGETPIVKQTKHWFLPLDRYEPWLKQWLLEEHKFWKQNVYGQCKSWLDQGLQPRAITRDLEWGVPVPLEEAKGKVLYVWFDAPIGYITATQEWAEKNNKNWEPYWKAEDTELIHFIGKDNIVFHCIIFPTMLKAHGGYILPTNVPANEFLNLEGKKISTSRNWAVWLHEYLIDFPNKQDILRYAICTNAPENRDCDFSWHDFQAKNNNELVAILGNFINRVFVLTHKYFDGHVPCCSQLLKVDQDLVNSLLDLTKGIGSSIEKFNFKEALQLSMEIARIGNKYLTETEPWHLIKTDKIRVGTILNLSIQIIANLSIVLYPFLPSFSADVRKMLGLNLDIPQWDRIGNMDILLNGSKLSEPKILFDKIDDKDIVQQLNKLGIA
jgi:methionyl-tRNA synthetase